MTPRRRQPHGHAARRPPDAALFLVGFGGKPRFERVRDKLANARDLPVGLYGAVEALQGGLAGGVLDGVHGGRWGGLRGKRFHF